MAKFKTLNCKRLWGNIASLRDYNVQDCIRKNLGIKITLTGSDEVMLIPHNELVVLAFQAHKTIIKSKFGKDYQLIDFAWRPNAK